MLTLSLVLGVSITILSKAPSAFNSSVPYAARTVLMYMTMGNTAPEPLANLYSADFYRSTWFTTALDTGFATAMPIQPKFLRDILSMVFFLYYLVYAREADEKVCIGP